MYLNKKGFMLAETMIVTAIVAVTLIGIYGQFNNVYDNYEQRLDYENVEKLYNTHGMSDLLIEEGMNYFIMLLELRTTSDTPIPYVDLTSCSNFINQDYCKEYVELTGIKKMVFTEYNLTDVIKFNYDNTFSAQLKTYMEYVDTSSTLSEGYRLIIEYNDNQFSTIKVN